MRHQEGRLTTEEIVTEIKLATNLLQELESAALMLKMQAVSRLYNELGLICAEVGLVDIAIKCYTQAIKHYSGDPQYRRNIGVAFYDAGNPFAAIYNLINMYSALASNDLEKQDAAILSALVREQLPQTATRPEISPALYLRASLKTTIYK